MSLKTRTPSKGLSYQDALLQIADKLQGVDQDYKIGSFWEFVRDVWSQSFDKPELFNAWHVGYLAEDIQDAVEQGLHYCAVLPRARFKSTILGHAFTMWRMLTQKKDLKVLYCDMKYVTHIQN